jgi:hypothetical protein
MRPIDSSASTNGHGEGKVEGIAQTDLPALGLEALCEGSRGELLLLGRGLLGGLLLVLELGRESGDEIRVGCERKGERKGTRFE